MSNSLDLDQADILLGLIWFKTVCKDYQQMALVGKELNEIKGEACQAFYLFFCNKLNKFNNTGAQMLDSIYHIYIV